MCVHDAQYFYFSVVSLTNNSNILPRDFPTRPRAPPFPSPTPCVLRGTAKVEFPFLTLLYLHLLYSGARGTTGTWEKQYHSRGARFPTILYQKPCGFSVFRITAAATPCFFERNTLTADITTDKSSIYIRVRYMGPVPQSGTRTSEPCVHSSRRALVYLYTYKSKRVQTDLKIFNPPNELIPFCLPLSTMTSIYRLLHP